MVVSKAIKVVLINKLVILKHETIMHDIHNFFFLREGERDKWARLY